MKLKTWPVGLGTAVMAITVIASFFAGVAMGRGLYLSHSRTVFCLLQMEIKINWSILSWFR